MPVLKSYDLTCDEKGNISQEDRTYDKYWILRLITFITLCCVIVEVCLLWSPSTNIVPQSGEQIEGSRLQKEHLKRIDALTVQVQNKFNLITVNGNRNSGIDTPLKQINIRDDKKMKNLGKTTISDVESRLEDLLNSSSEIRGSTEPSSTKAKTSKMSKGILKITP